MTVASKSTALARRAGALTGCTPDELERVAEALFASMVQPAWVIDRATLRFVAVNDAALALYGYSRKEFLALTIDAIRPAEDRPRLRAHMATDNGVGPHPRGRWRHYTKEGRLFPVEVTRHHLRWDGRPASLAVITDITQQDAVAEQLRRHESALRATHDLFHSVMESGSDPIFIKDL